jgi:hypothetical protein
VIDEANIEHFFESGMLCRKKFLLGADFERYSFNSSTLLWRIPGAFPRLFIARVLGLRSSMPATVTLPTWTLFLPFVASGLPAQ